jgi:hypothetical protein
MELIYNLYKSKFIEKYGIDKFDKLYRKVIESNALVKITGLSVQKGLPPTSTDFLLSANTILYVATKFDTYVSIMASIIELSLWNEKVNRLHRLVSEQHIAVIAERIVARWL